MIGLHTDEPPTFTYRAALHSLQRVGHEVSATLDLEHILHLVIEEAMRIGRATRGAIMLREPGSGEPGLETCTGCSKADEARVRALLQAPEPHPVWGKMPHTNSSLLIPDATDDEPASSTVIVPIFYSESPAGLIWLQSDEKNGFDQGVLEFVQALSSQVSIAIGNDQRYEEQKMRGELLSRRVDQLALVLEVSQALRSDRSLEDILEEIAYAIQESVGFNLVLISVLEGDPPYQRRVAAAGVPIATFELMKNVQQPWYILQEAMSKEFRISQSYYIPMEQRGNWQSRLDLHDYETTNLPRQPGHWHPQDMLLVPLVGPSGDTQGLLSVDQPRDGRIPDQATVEALEIFAGQAALAIENVRLVEALQHRANTLALFNEVNRSATAKLDLDEVLNSVVDMVPRLVECSHISIFVLDAESDEYKLRATYGSPPTLPPPSAFAQSEDFVNQVAQTGAPLAIDAASSHSIPRLAGNESGPVALTPLMTSDRAAGLLCVGRLEDLDFSADELKTLSALADQIAVAVENACLFDEVRRFSQELERRVEMRTQALGAAMNELTKERDRVETLYRITSQLSASLDLDRVLNRALEMVVEAVEAKRASILMLSPQSEQLIYRAAIGAEARLPLGGKPTRFSQDEGLGGWVIKHRTAAIVPDIQHDSRWIKSEDESEKQFRSALAVPLTSGDRTLGTLLLFHSQPNFFTGRSCHGADSQRHQQCRTVQPDPRSNRAVGTYAQGSTDRSGQEPIHSGGSGGWRDGG